MEDQPCCPLCHKDMSGVEVDELSTELNYKINALPEDIDRSERLLAESRAKLEKLLGMQSSVERVNKIQTELLPHLKDEIKAIETDLAANQEKQKKSEADLVEPKTKLNLIAPLIGDIGILDAALRDIDQTRTELEALRRNLPNGAANENCSMESMQAKRKEVSDRIKTLEKEITDKEKKLSDDESHMNKLKSKEMEMRTIELQLKSDMQKVDGLRAREQELRDEIAKLNESEKAKQNQLNPIKGKILNAEEKRRFAKSEGAKRVNKDRMEYNSLQKEVASIENLTKELEKLAERNLVNELDRYKKLLAGFRVEKDKKVKQVVSILIVLVVLFGRFIFHTGCTNRIDSRRD